MAQYAKFSGKANPPAPITVRDVLEFATIRGAECCALDRKCGSLAVGKEADIVMIRTDNVHLYSPNNAFGTVVQAATLGNVDTVFIAGQLRKWRGKLTTNLFGVDLSKIRQLADKSRNHLLTATGWSLDVFRLANLGDTETAEQDAPRHFEERILHVRRGHTNASPR